MVARAHMPEPVPAPGVGAAEKLKGCFESQARDKDLHDCGYAAGGRGTFPRDSKIWGPRTGSEGALQLRITLHILKDCKKAKTEKDV